MFELNRHFTYIRRMPPPTIWTGDVAHRPGAHLLTSLVLTRANQMDTVWRFNFLHLFHATRKSATIHVILISVFTQVNSQAVYIISIEENFLWWRRKLNFLRFYFLFFSRSSDN